jgi:hypothetical protein
MRFYWGSAKPAGEIDAKKSGATVTRFSGRKLLQTSALPSSYLFQETAMPCQHYSIP